MSKTITDNIKCCNYSNNLSYEHCIWCDGKYYYCWNYNSIQYINMDGKTTEGHNIICEKNYDCDYCEKNYDCDYCGKETLNIDKNIFIEFSDDFIFNIDKCLC